MVKLLSTKELRNMPVADLRRDMRNLQGELAKQRMGLQLGKEKNSGTYRAEKRQMARMLTVLGEKAGESLQSTKANSTVAAPAEAKPTKAPAKKRSVSTKKAS
jgi:ribosomal protein L29